MRKQHKVAKVCPIKLSNAIYFAFLHLFYHRVPPPRETAISSPMVSIRDNEQNSKLV